jgi:hypothetical protein
MYAAYALFEGFEPLFEKLGLIFRVRVPKLAWIVISSVSYGAVTIAMDLSLSALICLNL